MDECAYIKKMLMNTLLRLGVNCNFSRLFCVFSFQVEYFVLDFSQEKQFFLFKIVKILNLKFVLF